MATKKATTKKAAPKKPAHPLKVNGKDWDREKVVAHLCDTLATTSRGIGKILAAGYQGEILPSYSTVMKWLEEDADLSEKYARAKDAQAEFMADEILEIADDARNDWMEREDPDNPGFNFNGEHIQRSKLRVEARKWLASKLKPKKYGDRVQQEHSGQVQTVFNLDLSGKK